MRRKNTQCKIQQNWFVFAAALALLAGVALTAHRLYHAENAESATPNDCFAAAAAQNPALPTMVCRTFDDGPSKNTDAILQILDENQIPATWFVCAQDANEA